MDFDLIWNVQATAGRRLNKNCQQQLKQRKMYQIMRKSSVFSSDSNLFFFNLQQKKLKFKKSFDRLHLNESLWNQSFAFLTTANPINTVDCRQLQLVPMLSVTLTQFYLSFWSFFLLHPQLIFFLLHSKSFV